MSRARSATFSCAHGPTQIAARSAVRVRVRCRAATARSMVRARAAQTFTFTQTFARSFDGPARAPPTFAHAAVRAARRSARSRPASIVRSRSAFTFAPSTPPHAFAVRAFTYAPRAARRACAVRSSIPRLVPAALPFATFPVRIDSLLPSARSSPMITQRC